MNFVAQRERNRGQGGFTLIELLVVVAILAILGGVAVFAVGNLTSDSKASACKVEYDSIKTAIAAAEATSDGADDSGDFLDPATPQYWVITKDPVTNKETFATANIDGMAAGQNARDACDSLV